MATLRLFLLFLVLAGAGGCQKDVVTEGEKTAQSIQAVANESNITLANFICLALAVVNNHSFLGVAYLLSCKIDDIDQQVVPADRHHVSEVIADLDLLLLGVVRWHNVRHERQFSGTVNFEGTFTYNTYNVDLQNRKCVLMFQLIQNV